MVDEEGGLEKKVEEKSYWEQLLDFGKYLGEKIPAYQNAKKAYDKALEGFSLTYKKIQDIKDSLYETPKTEEELNKESEGAKRIREGIRKGREAKERIKDISDILFTPAKENTEGAFYRMKESLKGAYDYARYNFKMRRLRRALSKVFGYEYAEIIPLFAPVFLIAYSKTNMNIYLFLTLGILVFSIIKIKDFHKAKYKI